MGQSKGQSTSGAASAISQSGGLLAGSEHLLTALLESATQAIVGVATDGKIVLFNARTEEMFGYGREELAGSPIEILLPEGSRVGHTRHRAEYFAHPRPRPMGMGMELSGRRKDGSTFPVEVSLSFVRQEGKDYAIAFVSDISQRKRLEEQLLHAQRMEAVGRLAGGVAHDFNNMLTVISGYNQMLLDQAPPGPLRDYAEEIFKASNRAAALTSQLLTFSRRQIVEPKVFPVNDMLINTEKMLRRLIGEDIILSLRLAPDAGSIRVDRGRLEQVIFNLATNARDAMPRGGRLTIETVNCFLDEQYAAVHAGVKPGEYVMIAMTDSGQGMDAETRSRIFEPFFTTKDKGRGTGLGLSTVYGIVKQAGGDIWVYSEPNRGTVFKLYFPKATDPAEPISEKAAEKTYVGAETILLVEDEPAVRELSVKMLEQLGYKVLSASSGDEALAIAAGYKGEIPLVLTDVVMPNMGGVELTAELRRTRPDIRILYASGYTENGVSDRGGIDADADFLAKPFTREALGRKLRECLAKKSRKHPPS